MAHCQQERNPNLTVSCLRHALVALCCPLHVTVGTELNTVVFVRLTLVAADAVGNFVVLAPDVRRSYGRTSGGGGGDVKQGA